MKQFLTALEYEWIYKKRFIYSFLVGFLLITGLLLLYYTFLKNNAHNSYQMVFDLYPGVLKMLRLLGFVVITIYFATTISDMKNRLSKIIYLKVNLPLLLLIKIIFLLIFYILIETTYSYLLNNIIFIYGINSFIFSINFIILVLLNVFLWFRLNNLNHKPLLIIILLISSIITFYGINNLTYYDHPYHTYTMFHFYSTIISITFFFFIMIYILIYLIKLNKGGLDYVQ